MGELSGWHLERMAVGEYESSAGSSATDVAEIKRESRWIKHTLTKVLANGRSFQAKRDALNAAMDKQREVLTAELTEAKEFLVRPICWPPATRLLVRSVSQLLWKSDCVLPTSSRSSHRQVTSAKRRPSE